MTDLFNPGEIKKILAENETRMKKHLGQNFLINPRIAERSILAAEIKKNDIVLEIGPGMGGLTQELAKNCKKVIAIEIDESILAPLRKNLQDHKNIEIIHENALQYQPGIENYKIVANIPYYITSPLLRHYLIEIPNKPISLTLLVQKEVAEKMCQKEPDFNVLALQVQLYGKPRIIADVAPENFSPQPKVQSAIIHIETIQPDSADFIKPELAHKILKTAHRAFAQGRKKLSNTLPELKDLLTELGLANVRPQHLGIQDWVKILS